MEVHCTNEEAGGKKQVLAEEFVLLLPGRIIFAVLK